MRYALRSRRFRMRTSHFIVTMVLLTLLCSVVGAQEANRLQELIEKAPPGGEVVIPKGTYDQPVNITKPVKLRGEDRDGCVIEVASDEPAVRLQHKGQTVIEN